MLGNENVDGSATGEWHALMTQARAQIVATYEERTGVRAPQPLGPGASAGNRHAACVEFAKWARAANPDYFTQATIADCLNDRGQLTKRGKAWSQPTVSCALAQDAKRGPK